MDTHMFSCLHVKNLQDSTKTCFHVFSPFSAHFTLHYIVTDKGLFARTY